MLSHRYKTIFIHIPKCAGTTVERYFENLGAPAPYDCWPLPVLRKAGLAETINSYPDYFTFTFVRNPYARFVSYCHFGLEHIAKENNLPVGYNNMQECLDITEELSAINADNDDLFLKRNRTKKWRQKKVGPQGISLASLVYTRYHWLPQTYFLLDQNPSNFMGIRRINDAPCSFIGRQESFDKDFACLLDILDAPKIKEPFGHTYQREQQKHYSHYYDESSRRRVEKLYARDLEVLGYEFEQEGTISVLNPLCDPREAQKKRKAKTNLAALQWAEIYCQRVLLYLKGILQLLKRAHEVRKLKDLVIKFLWRLQ